MKTQEWGVPSAYIVHTENGTKFLTRRSRIIRVILTCLADSDSIPKRRMSLRALRKGERDGLFLRYKDGHHLLVSR
jgi:hypothetical protein